jgi:TolA-binding protein
VTAKDGKLVKVVVYEGRVEVRASNAEPTFLLPSQSWDVEQSKTVKTPMSASTTMASTSENLVAPQDPKTKLDPKKNSSEITKVKTGRSPAEVAFGEGTVLMGESKFEEASKSFLQAATLDPSSSIVEDARYRYAVALNRAGKIAQAQSALTSFIAQYPNSPLRGEAAVSLGKLLLDSGDLDGALIMFECAQDDPAEAVQQNAKNGLARVAKKRAASTPQP